MICIIIACLYNIYILLCILQDILFINDIKILGYILRLLYMKFILSFFSLIRLMSSIKLLNFLRQALYNIVYNRCKVYLIPPSTI